tara:strand:- start:942 stop:1157 length:216 start_codon:yes stop_codon:yes gene_type:complete
MRKDGSTTKKICWKLQIKNDDNIIFEKEYTTLKAMPEDLGITYNRVVELATGRKKQKGGKYDSIYVFEKIC